MERSELSEEVIALGRRLVAELDVGEDERDTLGRWMAHDLAQRIHAAETATGRDRESAREACAQAIFRAWEHRAVYPHDKRPFAGAEQALQILERLDPDNPETRYLRYAPSRAPKSQGADPWLETAVAVDKAARVILRACARLAARDKTSSDFATLAAAAGLNEDPDIRLVRILRFSDDLPEPSEADKAAARHKVEMAALRTFSTAAKHIRSALNEKSDDISVDDPKL